jgi:hypothetical protein
VDLGYQQREYTDFTSHRALKVDFPTAQPYSVEQRRKEPHTRVLYVVPVKRATLEVLRLCRGPRAKGFKSSMAAAGLRRRRATASSRIGYPLASAKLRSKGR